MLSRVGGRCTGIGAAVLAVALLLAGCSGAEDPEQGATAVPTGGPVAPTESAEPTPSGGSRESEEPTEPVPEPSPVPKPERPAAMDDTGEQGAIAAAQYFFELYNRAASTGETADLVAMGHEECGFCSKTAHDFEERYEQGTWIIGLLASLENFAAAPTADGLAFEVSFDIEVSGGTVYSNDGAVTTYEPARQQGARLVVQHFDDWKAISYYSGSDGG